MALHSAGFMANGVRIQIGTTNESIRVSLSIIVSALRLVKSACRILQIETDDPIICSPSLLFEFVTEVT